MPRTTALLMLIWRPLTNKIYVLTCITLLSGIYPLWSPTWAKHLMSKGLSPYEQSTLWVYFFSQICYHNRLGLSMLLHIKSDWTIYIFTVRSTEWKLTRASVFLFLIVWHLDIKSFFSEFFPYQCISHPYLTRLIKNSFKIGVRTVLNLCCTYISLILDYFIKAIN